MDTSPGVGPGPLQAPSAPIAGFSRTLWVLLGIVVIAGIGIFLYAKGYIPGLAQFMGPSGPTGEIYLSLLSDKGDPEHMGIYAYDVAKGTLSPYLPANYDLEEEYMTPAFSPDGKEVAVYAFSSTTQSIARFPADAPGEGRETVAATGEDVKLLRMPSWSPNGDRIAYMANKPGANIDFLNTEAWNVNVADLANNQLLNVGTGVYPHFITDNLLLVMKDDGLYELVHDEGTDGQYALVRVWSMAEGTAGNQMQFDVSRDKKQIAWTIPQQKTILVISVSSWLPFEGAVTREIPITAFWPVFSPDGRYLAAEAVDQNEENQRLAVYDLKDGREVSSYDLTHFLQTSLFMTAWQPSSATK